MTVETKTSQPASKQAPAPFDADRILDVLDARMDDFKYAMDGAQAEGRTDKSAEINWDRDGAISRTINRFGPEGRSTEEYVQYLRDMADQRQTRIASGSLSEREVRQQSEALKELLDTVRMIETDAANPELGNKRLEGYRARREEAAKRQTSEAAEADEIASAAEADEIRTEFGLDIEKEKTGLINEILKTCGARFHTAFPKSLVPGTSGGFFDKSDGKLSGDDRSNIKSQLEFLTGANYFASKYPEHKHGNIDKIFGDKGITEALYIQPVEETVYENKTTYTEEKQGGILGLGGKAVKVPRVERVAAGTRQLPMSEQVKGGDESPCYRLTYLTTNNDDDRKYQYQAPDGRYGQVFSAEVLLPQGLAEKVSAMVRENPEFLHQLIDELAVRDMGIPREVWEQGAEDANGRPIRPPYEKWRDTNGGKSKMYVVEQSQIANEIAQGTVDFDPNFVVEY